MPRARRSSAPIRRPAAERSSPPPAPSRHAPAHMPQQHVAAPAAASQGPGLMGQMAATAGGVAIGSVVGHGVSHALFGGGSSSAGESQPDTRYEQPMVQSQPPQQQAQQQPQVCSWELQQFLNCAQTQQDISLCDGFNEALKQCKRNYGVA
ncbi:coiled-coil-helix-coiled-coil-helix domain-containing protein 2-like [Clavelina lepadiformis]|uniref:Coiled-coil-helix-coiled-coil-helix domain-containing protein 2 n=1 Tax=Clavelina lepadiformis TaxID=159417 RepID=A0ABP0H1R0_CLALP